ncbi:hypothetical protein K1719_010881 [Acacia pycnantha]|nr:hypothetical protein K1719_010881 [Acacia pycnantha]
MLLCQMMKNDLFKSVGDNKDTWSIHAKVLRKWVIRRKAPLYPVWKIDMILVDKEVHLLGDTVEYLSSDSISCIGNANDSFEDLYDTEFLNTISFLEMPHHKLILKAKALNEISIGEDILIHHMGMNPSESKLPFNMMRRQFSIIISFAMTINKSQGQSMSNVGLYLSSLVFSHEQLYVALSRVKNFSGFKLLVLDEQKKCANQTTNVVYRGFPKSQH